MPKAFTLPEKPCTLGGKVVTTAAISGFENLVVKDAVFEPQSTGIFPTTSVDVDARRSKLLEEIRATLNRHCIENASNTPDFVLARYLIACLDAFDSAVNARELYYGRSVPPAGLHVRGFAPDGEG